jgi:hypothetical protein
MHRRATETIALPLHELRDLFTAPEADPIAEASDLDALDDLYESGMDYLVSHLRGNRLAKPGLLVLRLAPQAVQAVTAATARRAIDRYCCHKILETKRTLNELLWTGLKALQVGVLFLASCLGLAAALVRTDAAPGSFGDMLTQGLTIIGWVSMWRPVEIFLYEWWPLWRDVRIYDYILRMEIAIQPRR